MILDNERTANLDRTLTGSIIRGHFLAVDIVLLSRKGSYVVTSLRLIKISSAIVYNVAPGFFFVNPFFPLFSIYLCDECLFL